MSKSVPKPIYVHHGISGGATCSLIHDKVLYVGNNKGQVKMFCTESFLDRGNVFKDELHRRIQSINAMNDVLFVQIRAFAIIELIRSENSTNRVAGRIFEYDHLGFCNSIISRTNLIYFTSSGADFHKLVCRTLEKENEIRSLEMNIKATPMCLTTSTSKEDDELILAGFEDGTLQVMNYSNGSMNSKRIRKEPIFSIESCSSITAVGCSKSPIVLLSTQFIEDEEKLIHYPQTAGGCSALKFSPNCKQILAGFWDGSFRVFSLKRFNVLLAINDCHSATISHLIWKEKDANSDEMVVVSSIDQTVSIWSFK